MMTIEGGQTGLLSDHSWLIQENESLREMLKAERERARVAEQQFREIEHRLERANSE